MRGKRITESSRLLDDQSIELSSSSSHPHEGGGIDGDSYFQAGRQPGLGSGMDSRDRVSSVREGAYFDDDDESVGSGKGYSDNQYDPNLAGGGFRFHKGQVKTSRQRRKHVARSKSSKKLIPKRRIAVSCIADEIDTESLYENVESAQYRDWKRDLYGGEVLRLFKGGIPPPKAPDRSVSFPSEFETDGHMSDFSHVDVRPDLSSEPNAHVDMEPEEGVNEGIWNTGAREVFIFSFGVAVFWGFPAGGPEERSLHATIRKFATKSDEPVAATSAESDVGTDDLAFVYDPTFSNVHISNDVITLPVDSAKQRLAVSYAVAQSAVLSLFEADADNKMQDYKDIPLQLAKTGSVHLAPEKLGSMIGEVFVIRHDVNLYSDILDLPDIFWDDDHYEPDYKLVTKYLEVDERVRVLNTRVDMLRDLLSVLQQQMETAHASNLELIVIWLIVVEVVLQVFSMVVL